MFGSVEDASLISFFLQKYIECLISYLLNELSSS